MQKRFLICFIIFTTFFTLVASSPCPQHCADCGGDPSVCYACEPSFQLSVLNQCIPQTTVEKCILYGPTKNCFLCQPTFQLQNSKCANHFSACLNIVDGNCLQCGFGTVLQGGKCIGTINCNTAEKMCTKCVSGMSLKNGKCFPNEGCKSFDQLIGVCKQCQNGYQIIGYECVSQDKKVYDCYVYNNSMTCINCKYGFIPYQGQCLLPDDIQAIQTGVRTMADIILTKKQKYQAVYDGVKASSSSSTGPSTPKPTQQPFTIDNCKVSDPVNKICALCQDRYYRAGSKCLMVNNNCKDYDMVGGKCISCVDGLSLDNNGDCLKKVIIVEQQSAQQAQATTQGGAISFPSTNPPQFIPNVITLPPVPTPPTTTTTSIQKDLNCLKSQSTTNKCIQCSNKYFISPDNICVPVNPLCETYNQKGACNSCYKGYKLQGDVCIAAQQKDPYCKEVDLNNVCKSCFGGYFVNSSKNCQPLNPLCKDSDMSTGKCTICYMGYTLVDGSCKVFVKDPNCQQYEPTSNNCIKCPSRFFLSQGSCKSVSPLCKDYDKITGLCSQCYSGYVNDKGICSIATSKTDDLSCKQKKNGTCITCYNGFYLNTKSLKCQLQNLICKTINTQNGNCATCYNGYVIQGSTCIIATQQVTDIYCKIFNSNKKCTQCYSGYFVDPTTSLCKAFDPTCRESDKKTGACQSCYSGFNLISGRCVSDIPALGLNADQFCTKVDGSKCLQCNKGYFLATNNVCTQVDTLCKTYSLENGFCTSCYTGYVLSSSKCILAQELYIPFCKQVNSQGKCVQCNDRYYLANDICTPVSLLCDTYNKLTGKCLTCISGYFYQNSQCIYPALGIDVGCEVYTNAYCTQCKVGYYLESYFCKQIDTKCIDFDYNKNLCNKCFNSQPQGASCA